MISSFLPIPCNRIPRYNSELKPPQNPWYRLVCWGLFCTPWLDASCHSLPENFLDLCKMFFSA